MERLRTEPWNAKTLVDCGDKEPEMEMEKVHPVREEKNQKNEEFWKQGRRVCPGAESSSVVPNAVCR